MHRMMRKNGINAYFLDRFIARSSAIFFAMDIECDFFLFMACIGLAVMVGCTPAERRMMKLLAL